MSPDQLQRHVVRFDGHVQGVGFRVNCIQQAKGLEVHGWVRNEPDGSVLLDVDGQPSELAELLKRIKQSMALKIQSVDVQTKSSLGRTEGFRIAT